MYIPSLAALVLFLQPGFVFAAPGFVHMHDVVDYQPSVPTVRIAVVGTTAFSMFIAIDMPIAFNMLTNTPYSTVTFVVLILCLFLFRTFSRCRGSGRRHVSGTRRQNALRARCSRTSTDIAHMMPSEVERAFIDSFAAGAFVMGRIPLMLLAAPRTALGSGYARVYEGVSASLSEASLHSSAESSLVADAVDDDLPDGASVQV
ncbi:hypothetical protein EWM64_g9583 [Hericium alpestre]|uniref:Uncharacterized protein n=1 Tax=Hericium alpestre TaxID=135208 RepID=A0A4Y9ZJR7_9AGAM|nr:hypothetical protein EWM64_g9583 [Hericium alpestre]